MHIGALGLIIGHTSPESFGFLHFVEASEGLRREEGGHRSSSGWPLTPQKVELMAREAFLEERWALYAVPGTWSWETVRLQIYRSEACSMIHVPLYYLLCDTCLRLPCSIITLQSPVLDLHTLHRVV